MNDEQKDALRERNRRRAHACPRCDSYSVHEMTEAEIMRDSGTLPGLRYRTCGACGHTWAVKGRAR